MVAKTFTWTFLILSLAVVACYNNDKIYTNKWLVRIQGGIDQAEKLAQMYGFVNEGEVVSAFFSFRYDKVPERSSTPSGYLSELLLTEDQVLEVEQQNFRSYKLYSNCKMPFHDPRAGLQWYINADEEDNYNVKEVWKMNYTGKGIVVAVVDEGLNTTHPELRENYDKNASKDFVDGDSHPEPNDTYVMSGHGSKCAGIIAAKENNGHCGIGLAYNARIGGIRLFKYEMATDLAEANALSFNRQHIDIYSNSWGPDDRGFEVKGPGRATQTALREGATKGRGKKGSIFIFAAGNGGILSQDSCAYNGYVNSIYTIAITSSARDGSVPYYGERCPGIMATAFSRDSFGDRNPVVTAGQHGQCEFYFGGSSAATAMATGLVALALEANKNLTWRDVQHIIVRSARFPRHFQTNVVTNAAGLKVSNYMGFGLMDALKMVNFAKKWRNVPDQVECEFLKHETNSGRTYLSTINLNSSSCPIRFLEHVLVRVNLKVWPRGDLRLSLEAPSTTKSRLTQDRPYDKFRSVSTNLTDWVILSVHHWGENPVGKWTLRTDGNYRWLYFFNWTLTLFGTTLDPLLENGHVNVAPPVSKKKDAAKEKSVYIVEIKTGQRTRNGYRHKHPLRGDTKIKLFGEDGETLEQTLRSSDKTSSSQLYCIRARKVGNLTKIEIIRNGTDGRSYYIREVAIRREGNNPWIVLKHNNFISRFRVTTIKRACRRGYFRNDEGMCEDIDECKQGNKCPDYDKECHNTDGGYFCNCRSGYTQWSYSTWYGRSYTHCSDINECLQRGKGGCSHGCVNSIGSYRCTCSRGFRLNGRTCRDIDECHQRHKGGCSHGCVNTRGSFRCTCPRGFQLNGRTCQRLNRNDCIKIGAVFWGLWSKKDDSINYFRAFISRIDDNWLKFYLEVNPRQTRTYKKTQPVLIIDKVPEKKDVLLGSLVIAVHRNSKTDWYRTGKVEEIGSYWHDGKFRVKFDNGRSRWVPQSQIRLVKRPEFC